MPYRSTALTRANADARREEFLRAAISLVAARGFAEATVVAIARENGSSVGLVYSYYKDRDHLLAAVFRSAAGRELAAVQQAVGLADDPIAKIAALIHTFTRRALVGRQLAWSLLFEPVGPAIETERLVYRRAYRGLGEDIIRAGISESVFSVQSVEVSASAVMGAIAEALYGSLNPATRQSGRSAATTDVVGEIRDFCLRALGHRREGQRDE